MPTEATRIEMHNKYDKYKLTTSKHAMHCNSVALEIEKFDWNKRGGLSKKIEINENISPRERSLYQLYSKCNSCNLCDIGSQLVAIDGIYRSIHLPNNLKLRNIMIIYNSPSQEDIRNRDLILGNEEDTVGTNAFVTYLVKCYTETYKESYFDKCARYIDEEINIIEPKLIVAMDEEVFDCLKRDKSDNYTDNLRKLVNSKYICKLLALDKNSIADNKFVMSMSDRLC